MPHTLTARRDPDGWIPGYDVHIDGRYVGWVERVAATEYRRPRTGGARVPRQVSTWRARLADDTPVGGAVDYRRDAVATVLFHNPHTPQES